MKYRLAWKYLKTNVVKKGEPIFACRQIAHSAALAMDKAYPDIEHWVEHVEDSPAKPAPATPPLAPLRPSPAGPDWEVTNPSLRLATVGIAE